MLRLRLEGQGSNVERAELLLPNKGFSRWFELENRTVVTDEDPTQREQALAWALERISPAVEAAMPGARPIQDYVPEPIDPPRIALTRTGAAETGDEATDRGERELAAGAPPTPPTPAATPDAGTAPTPPSPNPGGAGQQPSEIDILLNQASGSDAGTGTAPPPVEPPPAEPPPTAEMSMVLPISVRAWQTDQLRVVVFAAPAEDYGTAYDGFFIERIRATPPAAPPTKGRRTPVRRPAKRGAGAAPPAAP
jgi:hypothetical protein